MDFDQLWDIDILQILPSILDGFFWIILQDSTMQFAEHGMWKIL